MARALAGRVAELGDHVHKRRGLGEQITSRSKRTVADGAHHTTDIYVNGARRNTGRLPVLDALLLELG